MHSLDTTMGQGAVGGAPLMGVVGRDPELATIRALLRQVEDGSAQNVRVIGEAGMGKSALLGAVLRELPARGWTVISGQADALERSIPFAALARMVPVIQPRGRHDASAELAVELRSALDALGAGGRAEIEASFGRTCSLATELFSNLLDRRPLVIAIDDMDALDDDSLALAGIVVRRLAGKRLALLGTGRPMASAAPQALRGLAARVREAVPGDVLVRLGPLDAVAIAALAAPVLGAAPDAALAAEVHRRSDGIPFFALEIAASLHAEGVVAIHGGRARLTVPAADVRLTRARALVDRLLPLAPDARAVLEALGVAGGARTAHVDWLAAATGLREAAVARALDELVAADVLAESGDGYRFRHALVREAADAMVGPARRHVLHAQIATRLIADRAAGAPVDLQTLARHVSASAQPGDTGSAALLAEAGDAARAMAPRSAAELYARAAEISPPDDSRRTVALARRCRALSEAALPTEAVRAGTQALEQLPDGRERRSTTNAMIHSLVEMGRLDEALDVADAEIARGTASAVTTVDRARVLWMLERFDEALDEARRAEAMPVGSEAERLLVLGPLNIMSACAAQPLPLAALTDEMLRLAHGVAPTLELYATSLVAYARATAGHVAAAVAPLERAEALLDEVGGGLPFRSRTLLARVFVDWLQGRWDAAIEQADAARAELEGAHYELQIEALDGIAIEINARRGGRIPDALAVHRAGCANFGDLKAWAIAGARLATGDSDGARAALDRALARGDIGVAYRTPLLARGVELSLATGDRPAAEAQLAALETNARERSNPWTDVLVLRCRAAVDRDPGAARAAMAAAEASGHTFERLLAALLLAELDPTEHELLTDSYRAFGALEADPLRREAGRLLRARGLRVPRARRNGDGPLSDSEMKVALLVQDGLRNKEIASALHYSPRTVEHIISRIFSKLEVSSRVQLARALDASSDYQR